MARQKHKKKWKDLKDLNEQLGYDCVDIASEHSGMNKVGVIPTQSISLNMATRIGGVPRARIVEVFGPEGDGKTALVLGIIGQAQADGGKAAFIDMEWSLTNEFAVLHGVDVKNLVVAHPANGNDALDLMEALVRSCKFDVVALDSVAALVTEAELETSMSDDHMAPGARLMSNFMRKLPGVVGSTETVAIFINQLRDKPGVVYGQRTQAPGGRALKFYSSMRLEIARMKYLKGKDNERIGHRVKIRVVKNKVGKPFGEAELDYLYDSGFDLMGDRIDVAVELGIIKKEGTSYFIFGGKKYHGRSGMVQGLIAEGKLEDLDKQIMETLISDVKEKD